MKFHTIGLNIVDTSRCRCNGIILHIRISLKEEVIITHKVRNFFDYCFFLPQFRVPTNTSHLETVQCFLHCSDLLRLVLYALIFLLPIHCKTGMANVLHCLHKLFCKLCFPQASNNFIR